MKKVYCTVAHNPAAGTYGDCQRAAIATLLGLEAHEVEHFADGGPKPNGSASDFQDRIDAWLAKRGLTILEIKISADRWSLKATLQSIAINCGDDPAYLLSGKSGNGTFHTVVCVGDTIFHDPTPNQPGIIGPCSDGNYLIAFIVREGMTLEKVGWTRGNRLAQ